MTILEFNAWTLTVDLLCRNKLACSWNDLCGDKQSLRDAFESGLSPDQFVDRWVEKYDLVSLEEVLHPFGEVPSPDLR